tara:strand:- start:5475 stop:5708 length:234 start_codon:yes stop_codon:yes gene_type:complete
MTDMTKKEMEARITELEEERETILQQAIQVQTVAQNRLVSLRLLEGFVNEVTASLNKFMRDVNELGLQQQEREESED